MNKSDSDLMAVSLREQGYHEAESSDVADVVIYNTCSVRQHAEDRVTARISSNRHQIRKRGGTIVIAGCMAQRRGQELLDSKLADLVIGPYQSPRIGEILEGSSGSNKEVLYISQSEEDFQERLHPDILSARQGHSWHQWVTITHGCENFCAYCIVPYVRGKLISVASADILKHIQKLAAEGIREITLLGQNVNQYGQDRDDLPFYRLLASAAETKGLERVNFLTSHPKDFSEDIARVIADFPNISRNIHLPLQSGSDTVLKKMNRQYSMDHYYRHIESLAAHLDVFSVSTDLIVGFPGETEKDFEDTLKAVSTIRYDEAFMYAYSPRSGTPAAQLEETLPQEEKITRLNTLINLQRNISVEKLEARVNTIEIMIPEKISKHSAGEVMGRTFLNHPAVIPGTEKDIGRAVKVQVTGVNGSTLLAHKIP